MTEAHADARASGTVRNASHSDGYVATLLLALLGVFGVLILTAGLWLIVPRLSS